MEWTNTHIHVRQDAPIAVFGLRSFEGAAEKCPRTLHDQKDRTGHQAFQTEGKCGGLRPLKGSEVGNPSQTICSHVRLTRSSTRELNRTVSSFADMESSYEALPSIDKVERTLPAALRISQR